MKDSYSFDIDAAGLDESFDQHDAVYRRIFTRCGLKFVAVEADSGAMGGSQSQEFMVYTDAGEDLIASCAEVRLRRQPGKGHLAASSRSRRWSRPATASRSWSHTPGCAAIADVAAFFKISPASDIKCVAYMALKRGAAGKAATRGTASLHSCAAITRSTKPSCSARSARRELRTMQAEELEQYFNGPAGYLGPVGLDALTRSCSGDGLTVIVDKALEGRKNLVAGANKLDYHLRNVVPGRDFTWTVTADIRSVNEGEGVSHR